MDHFKTFFNTFKCGKGVPYTHTSIGKPSCSLNVPEDRHEEFYENYHRAMVQSFPLHLTEKPTDPSPMRVDLDYRFQMVEPKPEILPRCYTQADTERILTKYFELLALFLDAPDEAWTAYVMEKMSPVEYRGKLKDGIHVVWPHLVTTHSFQHLIRKHMLDDAAMLFESMRLTNPADDVIDQAIIDKNNWQMYGSRKPDCEAYRVTYVYSYNRITKTLDCLPKPTAQDELSFVKLLSMRGKEAQLVPIFREKQEEVNEYIRHVLPTMDDRRKNKLHGQIFGNTANLTKNIVGEGDLDLARKLVTECINPKRAESYEDWIKLGWTLRNIDYRLLDSWVELSRVSSKYIEGECQNMWNRMRNDTMGMGTLRWIAQQDNPMKYHEILDGNIVELLDRAIGSDGAHYDVAVVVHAMFKDRYRFTNKDIWYLYREDCHRWVRSKEGLKLRVVLSDKVCRKFMDRSIHWNGEAARSHQDEEQRERFESRSKKALQIGLKLKDAKYKDNIIKECKSLFTDEKFEETLDSHPHLIGFENGVYDLRLHEFRDGLSDDYISFSTKRNYTTYNSESVEAKELNAYLAQVFTNPNVRKYMIDVMSTILDGGMRQEKFYIYTGNGSNSKSKLIELIQQSIGDYFCILPIALLTQKRSASNSAQSELERTKGRRLAVMQEPGESEKLNIGLMKELTGGDIIQCRGLFKEPVEFRPQFKMIMTCNELPEVPSDDGGTWRRIRVVEYTSKFLENPNPEKDNEFPLDPQLNEKMERWTDTFVSMLIAHHKTIDLKNIVEPNEVIMATNSYRANNDFVSQYLDEMIIVDPTSNERMMLNKIFGDFKSWAYKIIPKGKKIPDRIQIRISLEKRFGPYIGTKGWKGFKMRTSEEDGRGSDADD
jgi:P4 family phage/plasmid primase-like protien